MPGVSPFAIPEKEKAGTLASPGLIKQSNLVAATATAIAAAAAAVIHIVDGRQAAQFEGLGHPLHDEVLDAADFLLRIEEVLGDHVGQQAVAQGVELPDLLFGKRHAHLLLLLEHLALEAQGVILAAGSVVFEEGVDVSAQALKFRLVQDRFAQFGGLACDLGVGFSGNHGSISIVFRRRQRPSQRAARTTEPQG